MKVEILLSILVFLPWIHPTINFGDTEFSTEIADTPEERAIGLMGKKSIRDDEGMLFIYPREDERSFWMKNTTIPLDIIFMDSNLKVINIEKADPEPNTSEEFEMYRSKEPAQYVLEINQNRSQEIELEEGEEMRLGLEIGLS